MKKYWNISIVIILLIILSTFYLNYSGTNEIMISKDLSKTKDPDAVEILNPIFKNKGLKVVLGAADTFRAAAINQLEVWANRVDVPIIKQNMGSDPASVAFDTLQSAISSNADVVIIDTAGRLHNKINLMNELTKIKRVMQKVVPNAPHEILLVLDGSTGQNAFEQAKQFTASTEVNTLAITKLDGTAKGGVVIGISDQFQVPVKYIGVGEGMSDLQVFNKFEFVDSFFN